MLQSFVNIQVFLNFFSYKGFLIVINMHDSFANSSSPLNMDIVQHILLKATS